MIEYFVTYMGREENGQVSVGRSQISVEQPVRSIEDVEAMEHAILTQHRQYQYVAITGWRRFEEKD